MKGWGEGRGGGGEKGGGQRRKGKAHAVQASGPTWLWDMCGSCASFQQCKSPGSMARALCTTLAILGAVPGAGERGQQEVAEEQEAAQLASCDSQ